MLERSFQNRQMYNFYFEISSSTKSSPAVASPTWSRTITYRLINASRVFFLTLRFSKTKKLSRNSRYAFFDKPVDTTESVISFTSSRFWSVVRPLAIFIVIIGILNVDCCDLIPRRCHVIFPAHITL